MHPWHSRHVLLRLQKLQVAILFVFVFVFVSIHHHCLPLSPSQLFLSPPWCHVGTLHNSQTLSKGGHLFVFGIPCERIKMVLVRQPHTCCLSVSSDVYELVVMTVHRMVSAILLHTIKMVQCERISPMPRLSLSLPMCMHLRAPFVPSHPRVHRQLRPSLHPSHVDVEDEVLGWARWSHPTMCSSSIDAIHLPLRSHPIPSPCVPSSPSAAEDAPPGHPPTTPVPRGRPKRVFSLPVVWGSEGLSEWLSGTADGGAGRIRRRCKRRWRRQPPHEADAHVDCARQGDVRGRARIKVRGGWRRGPSVG